MGEVADRLPEHLPRLYRYARSLTRDDHRAQDLVGDTCVRALEKQHRYERGTNLRGWLVSIMHNLFVSQVRGQRMRTVDLEGIEERSCQADQLSRSLALRDADRAFAKLMPLHREALWLHTVEQMEIAEIALHLGIAKGTVSSRLNRARRSLALLMRQAEAPIRQPEPPPPTPGAPPSKPRRYRGPDRHKQAGQLWPRQLAFAHLIARGHIKRHAAIAAGYPAKGASVAAYYMMNHAGVIAEIEAERARLLKPASE